MAAARALREQLSAARKAAGERAQAAAAEQQRREQEQAAAELRRLAADIESALQRAAWPAAETAIAALEKQGGEGRRRAETWREALAKAQQEAEARARQEQVERQEEINRRRQAAQAAITEGTLSPARAEIETLRAMGADGAAAAESLKVRLKAARRGQLRRYLPRALGAAGLLVIVFVIWGWGRLFGPVPTPTTQARSNPAVLETSPVSVTQPPAETAPTEAPQIFPIDGMELIYIPAGEFLMGSTESDSLAYDDEKPQHTVYLDAYWIDRTEVTNAMYAAFLNTQTNPEAYSDGCDLAQSGGEYVSASGTVDHPVACVDWFSAQAYCAWAGRRLPTEAEWEKAARGTDGRTYPWGDEPVSGERLNFCDVNCIKDWADKSIDDGYAITAPVGSFPSGASPYGVLDMAGNVWEWVADWYDGGYYGDSPGENPTGPASGDGRVLRGGSWNNLDRLTRSANRNRLQPDYRYDDYGFRCARSP